MLNGVWVARLKLLNPPAFTTFDIPGSPACAPNPVNKAFVSYSSIVIRDGDGDAVQSILCCVFGVDDWKTKEEANGPVMDKVADALTESMGKEWQAMIQKSSGKKELHEKLAKIFSDAQQKQK
jgi:hypothetical protein